MDQTRFDFPEDTPQHRRRRSKRRAAARSRRQPAQNLTLAASPVLQRCGRCGHEQTVLGETALCAQCGGIMVRKEKGEDEEWPSLPGLPEADEPED